MLVHSGALLIPELAQLVRKADQPGSWGSGVAEARATPAI